MTERKEKSISYSVETQAKYEASYRIPIDYRRAGILKEIEESYGILVSKGRSKSQYITDAIVDLENNPRTLTSIEELVYEARKIDILKLNRGLTSIEDYKRFFEDEKAIQRLRVAISAFDKKPAKMTLGFNRTCKKSEVVLEYLGALTPKERVTTISNAVLTYIKRGNDIKGLSLLADKDLYEMSVAYKELDEEEKKRLLRNLNILIEQSDKLLLDKGIANERATTFEIQKYFI